jgi:iron complex outermembrane receptor protein
MTTSHFIESATRLHMLRALCLCAVSGLALSIPTGTADAQSALPPVTVDAPQQRTRPATARPTQRASTSRAARTNRTARAPQAAPVAPANPNAGERAGGPVIGFVANRSGSATKTDTPIMETPQSISVITSDQIKTQDAQTLTQALRYTAGANGDVNGGSDTRNGGIQIRGFDMTQQGLYLDGLRLPSTPYIHFDSLDPFGASRLEVLKGPSSVMYGGSGPGGILNYVSKLPTARQFGEISVSGGSFDRYQGEFDFGGPANKEGTVLYRLTGLVRDGGTQVDDARDSRVFIAPAVTFKPNEDTTLTVLANYQKEKNGWGLQFLPASGTIYPNAGRIIPINRNTGEPGFNRYDNEIASVGYLFAHNINDNLTFRQNLRYSWMHNESDSINAGGYLDEAAGLLYRYGGSSASTINSIAVDNQLEGHFTTGILSHTTLFGIDYRNTTSTDVNTSYSADPLNVFNPVYTNTWTKGALYEDYRVKQSQVGIYAQDQIKLGRLSVQLGGRQDFAKTTYDNYMDGSSTSTDASAFTGRAGVIYNFDSGVAPYYSYSESFLPVLNIANGSLLAPETAHQHEVGIKYQPVGVNAMITLAAFDLTRQNVVRFLPVAPFTAIQTGEVNSRGIELEATATLAAGFNVRAAYSYIDIEVTKDPVNVGKALTTVPMNRLGIWSDYTMQGGLFEGVQVGGGIRYIGDSWADDANTSKVPGATVVDALLAYNQKNYRLALNVTNIADTRYVSSCYSPVYGCFYGDSRKVVAKLTYRW